MESESLKKQNSYKIENELMNQLENNLLTLEDFNSMPINMSNRRILVFK